MGKYNEAIQGFLSRADYPQALLRFRSSYIVRGSGCWEWIGSIDRFGYARFSLSSNGVKAHRLAFFLIHGYLPKTTDHLCRNRKCVNDLHLEDVDNRTNVLRGVGPTAENARKETCKRGHELSPIKAGRECRVCKKEDNRKVARRRKLERARRRGDLFEVK